MRTDNIHTDTDFHILQGKKKRKPFYQKLWFWLVAAGGLCLIIIACIFFFIPTRPAEVRTEACLDSEDILYDMYPDLEENYMKSHELSSKTRGIDVYEASSNGLRLRIFNVADKKVELKVGAVDAEDSTIFLAVCAVDVKNNNGEIAGPLVNKGELLSRGTAPKGFCAIIHDDIVIGAAENSPYLEAAINNEGDFFRQYPLVVDGLAIHNKPKGTSTRRALCEKDGEILVIECNNASFDDFAQALEDFGVSSAISLVGGDSYGFFRTLNQQRHDFGSADQDNDPMISFLIWR